VIVSDARFLRVSTFYARTGDRFAHLSALVTLAMLIVARRRTHAYA